MSRTSSVQTFFPHHYMTAFPPTSSNQTFVAPTYICKRSGEILLAPKAFIAALSDGFLNDALMASEKTRHLTGGNKKNRPIGIGFKNYSIKSLEVYHSALLHFLAWTEMRGIEAQDTERFHFQNILHYRAPRDHAYASIEDYESDMMDKRRPGLRSKNPNAVRTRVMIANAFIAFCVAQGIRKKPFSPYLSSASGAYLDRDELLQKAQSISKAPEIEVLSEFVDGQISLRDRVATGLMLFGGLRVEDMLPMRICDVPRRLDVVRVGNYRVELKVFGKGHKWRTTTIPEWVYNDLRDFASSERTALRKNLLLKGQKLPMGKEAPIFVSTKDTPNFGKPLTSKFIRNIFEGSVFGHPHNARHAFACWRMIELLGMRAESHQQRSTVTLTEMGIHGDVKDTLALEMGHSSIETTEVYLKWARRRIIDRDTLPFLLSRIQKVHHGR